MQHSKDNRSLSFTSSGLFRTCGRTIDLSARSRPDSIIIAHEIPEAVRHFSTLRTEKNGFDVTIIVENVKINAHKDLLCSRIPYFRCAFESHTIEATKGEVDLSARFDDDVTLLSILDYAYSGMLNISVTNAPALMVAATYLMMDSIVNECALFMGRRLTIDNAFPLLDFYRSYAYDAMHKIVNRFIETNIVPISRTRHFLDLPITDLCDILNRDSLNVDSEEQIFHAAARWMHQNPEMLSQGPKLLLCVRCPLLSSSFLAETVEKTAWVVENSECKDIVEQAKESIRNSHNRSEIPFKSTERKCDDAPRLFLCFDGYGNETDINIYNPMDRTWTTITSRDSCTLANAGDAVLIDKKVYFVSNGGSSVYDTSTNEWKMNGPNRDSDRFMGITTIDGKIFVAGGKRNEGGTLSILESIDPSAETPVWASLQPMSKARQFPATCFLHGKLYVFGGYDERTRELYKDGEVYNPETGRWTPIAQRNLRRYCCATAAFKGKIYTVGGREFRRQAKQTLYYDDVEVYDPSTNTWTILNPMQTREMTYLGESCGKLFAMLGIRDGDKAECKSVMEYNEETDTWEQVSTYHETLWLYFCALSIPATFGCPVVDIERVSVESSGFGHLQLSSGLLKAIIDDGFDHPSEAQQKLFTQSILGRDMICHAKPSAGKTAGAVISTLRLLEPVKGRISALVISHSRKAATNMKKAFARFTKYLPEIETAVFSEASRVTKDTKLLKNPPHIAILTPRRLQKLIDSDALSINYVKIVIIDDCDRVIGDVDTRVTVEKILASMPLKPQMMLFSSDMSLQFRCVCKEFIQDGTH